MQIKREYKSFSQPPNTVVSPWADEIILSTYDWILRIGLINFHRLIDVLLASGR